MIDERPIRVLLIDDSEDDYMIIKSLLSRVQGTTYNLEWVSTYDEAAEALKHNGYDIYLIDYRLGKDDALELINSAVSCHKRVPIIVLTGQGDLSVDIKAMKSGASNFLVKGQFDSTLLERSIRYAVERNQSERLILAMAYNDSLTGLPNRILFKDHLNMAIAQAQRSHHFVAVIFIDIDNFKQINDSLGHATGDILLSAIGERLTDSLRRSDTISRLDREKDKTTLARWGGDEFILLLTDIKYPCEVTRAANRIFDALSQPFLLDTHEVHATVSIGIAIYPQDCNDADTLMKNADIAMYSAKEGGRNSFRFYNKSMDFVPAKKYWGMNELKRALDQDEFRLYYLPQVDISTGKMTGLEALLRWNHKEKGIIPPAEFVPLAEESGMIRPIGSWVLKSACIQRMAWKKAGLQPVNVSVNISCTQFRQRNLDKVIEKVLGETGMDPGSLELEITESLMMQDVQSAIVTLNNLKALGVRISLDDFGTGYSSIRYLQRLPLYNFKIDRSFIADVVRNSDDNTIAKLIIATARALNISVVAEGVETREQLEFLFDHGCTAAQGYFVSRPVPAEDVPALLSRETGGDGVGIAAFKSLTARHESGIRDS